MATISDPFPGSDVRLSREMSVFSVTMIGVGAMIGAGIFVLTGIAAGVAGPALILVFLLNSVVTLFTAMALLLPIEDVASAADIMFLFIFMQVNVVVIRLRKKRPDLDRGFRIPFMPVIPILGIATQVFIAFYLVQYSPKAFLTAVAWIGAGAVIYYLYASKKEAGHVEYGEAYERLVRKDYRILVTLDRSEDVAPLMNVALALARQFDGEIVAVAVIEVPFQTPLTSGPVMPEVKGRRNNLRLAEHLAEQESVPCRRYIKVTHRLSEAILDTAREEECNFIILGRSARPRFGSRVVRSFMDRVLMESPCHVAVVKCADLSKIDRILVPVDDDRNSRLALELLPAFISRWNASTEIMALAFDGSHAGTRAGQLLQRLSEEIAFPSGARTSHVEGVIPTQEVLEKVGPSDLIVMGESQWTGFAHLFGSTLPDEIAEQTERPVVFIKAYVPKRRHSLLFRLLTGA